MASAGHSGESLPRDAIEKFDADLLIRSVKSAQWDVLGEHVVVLCEWVPPKGPPRDRLLAIEAPAAAALLLLLSRVFADTNTTALPEQ